MPIAASPEIQENFGAAQKTIQWLSAGVTRSFENPTTQLGALQQMALPKHKAEWLQDPQMTPELILQEMFRTYRGNTEILATETQTIELVLLEERSTDAGNVIEICRILSPEAEQRLAILYIPQVTTSGSNPDEFYYLEINQDEQIEVFFRAKIRTQIESTTIARIETLSISNSQEFYSRNIERYVPDLSQLLLITSLEDAQQATLQTQEEKVMTTFEQRSLYLLGENSAVYTFNINCRTESAFIYRQNINSPECEIVLDAITPSGIEPQVYHARILDEYEGKIQRLSIENISPSPKKEAAAIDKEIRQLQTMTEFAKKGTGAFAIELLDLMIQKADLANMVTFPIGATGLKRPIKVEFTKEPEIVGVEKKPNTKRTGRLPFRPGQEPSYIIGRLETETGLSLHPYSPLYTHIVLPTSIYYETEGLARDPSDVDFLTMEMAALISEQTPYKLESKARSLKVDPSKVNEILNEIFSRIPSRTIGFLVYSADRRTAKSVDEGLKDSRSFGIKRFVEYCQNKNILGKVQIIVILEEELEQEVGSRRETIPVLRLEAVGHSLQSDLRADSLDLNSNLAQIFEQYSTEGKLWDLLARAVISTS